MNLQENENTNETHVYFILHENGEYTISYGKVVTHANNPDMYTIVEAGTDIPYIVRGNRVFRLKTNAIKRLNTIKRMTKNNKLSKLF